MPNVPLKYFALLLANHLIDQFIYDHALTRRRYLEMLQNQIIPAVRKVFENHQSINLWFQQYGCPAHNSRKIQLFLTKTFGNKVISNSGAVR